MELIRERQARAFSHEASVTVHDYPTTNPNISGATAFIKGRYPAEGFVMNSKVHEMAFVMAGSGMVHLQGQDIPLEIGDLVLLQPEEAFAWSGQMTLFIATAPRFEPEQYGKV